MKREEAAHIVDLAFSVPLAVRKVGEARTYQEDECREAKNMAIQALTQEPYKGMTNGQVHDMLYQMLVELKDGADRYGAEKWWNSPYEPQERSEE